MVDEYPELQAVVIEVTGWGWFPIIAEEARRCLKELLFEDWEYVVEVTVAGGAQKRVFMACAEGSHAWKIACQLGPSLQAQLETFTNKLSVHLVLDSNRVRYEFPIQKEIVAAILEKQDAAAEATRSPADAPVAASSSGAAAVRAPQTLKQIIEYTRGLPESEGKQYFTKEGMREHSCLLELHDAESRPHGLVRFLLWEAVSREARKTQRDAFQLITRELRARICKQATQAEVWLLAVEDQLVPPSQEQWARFREFEPPARQLVLNVLVGRQVRHLRGALAARYSVAEDDDEELFKNRLRELLVPHLEETIRLEGRHLAERGIKGQLRAAVYCARMMDLLPPAGKGEKGAESIRLLSQIDAFSPEERKKMAKEFNIACLRTFVDVLDSVAWKLWREQSEISVESLRAGLVDKEIIDVEDRLVPEGLEVSERGRAE